jgi:predicted secreted protein
MTSNARIGFGTTLTINGGDVAEITSVSGPGMSAKMIDVTNHASTSGWAEFVQGIKDGGEISLEGNFYPGDADGQVALHTAFNNGTVDAYVITLPTAFATSLSFSGLVQKYEIVPAIDKQVGFKVSIKVSGVVTLAITASANWTSVTISSGTLTPATSATVYHYADIVAAATATVTVTHSASEYCRLYVDGVFSQSLTSTTPSSAIAFASPSFHELRIDCKDTNKVVTSYVIECARA